MDSITCGQRRKAGNRAGEGNWKNSSLTYKLLIFCCVVVSAMWLWDLSSPARFRTLATEFCKRAGLPAGPPGNSLRLYIFQNKNLKQIWTKSKRKIKITLNCGYFKYYP